VSRQDEHLDALLKHLGAAYYQTLRGGAAAWDVQRAVDSVEAAEAARRAGGTQRPHREGARPGGGGSAMSCGRHR
jgi:hypothetical protein